MTSKSSLILDVFLGTVLISEWRDNHVHVTVTAAGLLQFDTTRV